MAKTLTEVEVKKTTTTHNNPGKTTTPVFEERPRQSRRIWVLAPLGLLAVGAATFLVVRRWLKDDGDGRLI